MLEHRVKVIDAEIEKVNSQLSNLNSYINRLIGAKQEITFFINQLINPVKDIDQLKKAIGEKSIEIIDLNKDKNEVKRDDSAASAAVN